MPVYLVILGEYVGIRTFFLTHGTTFVRVSLDTPVASTDVVLNSLAAVELAILQFLI